MSDKTSDKRYRITLTENQFALVGTAVEIARISCTVCGASAKEVSDSVRELKTLYEAIRHQQWLDGGEPGWDVRSHKPMKFGEEPVPEIERIDE